MKNEFHLKITVHSTRVTEIEINGRIYDDQLIKLKPNHPMEIKEFTVTENGFSMTSNKVSVPACKIKATNFLEAAAFLTKFLETRVKLDEIELITPIDRIDFRIENV